jgi:pilus assembly protein CpaE
MSERTTPWTREEEAAAALAMATEGGRAAVAAALAAHARTGATGTSGVRDRIFAIYAPTGGAGATSLAVAFAERLHAHGLARVLLLDLNLALGHVAPCLAHPCEYGPLDLLDDLGRLDEDLLFSRLARHPAGFWFASSGENVEDVEAVAPEALARLVAALAPHFDALVLDVPHDVAPRTRAALAVADRVLFLAADGVPALKRARSALRALGASDLAGERIAVVRRAGFGRELADADLAAALGVPVAALWPHDPAALAAAARAGELLSRAAPRSRAARAADALALRAAGRAAAEEPVLARVRRLLGAAPR